MVWYNCEKRKLQTKKTIKKKLKTNYKKKCWKNGEKNLRKKIFWKKLKTKNVISATLFLPIFALLALLERNTPREVKTANSVLSDFGPITRSARIIAADRITRKVG